MPAENSKNDEQASSEKAARKAREKDTEKNTEKDTEKTGEKTANKAAGPGAESGARRAPEASLLTLAQMLFLQGMIALEAAPSPASGKTEKDLAAARFQIGLLEMLEEKTRGNATPDEQAVLDGLLHTLRMSFVEASKK